MFSFCSLVSFHEAALQYIYTAQGQFRRKMTHCDTKGRFNTGKDLILFSRTAQTVMEPVQITRMFLNSVVKCCIMISVTLTLVSGNRFLFIYFYLYSFLRLNVKILLCILLLLYFVLRFSLFFQRLHYVLCFFILIGASLSDQVHQAPAEIYCKQGGTVKITCSHSIDTYNRVLWYKQTKDRQLQLLGYMLADNAYPENEVDVEMNGNANKDQNCTLTVKNLMQNSSVYFCAASLHSDTCVYSTVQKPHHSFLIAAPCT